MLLRVLDWRCHGAERAEAQASGGQVAVGSPRWHCRGECGWLPRPGPAADRRTVCGAQVAEGSSEGTRLRVAARRRPSASLWRFRQLPPGSVCTHSLARKNTVAFWPPKVTESVCQPLDPNRSVNWRGGEARGGSALDPGEGVSGQGASSCSAFAVAGALLVRRCESSGSLVFSSLGCFAGRGPGSFESDHHDDFLDANWRAASVCHSHASAAAMVTVVLLTLKGSISRPLWPQGMSPRAVQECRQLAFRGSSSFPFAHISPCGAKSGQMKNNSDRKT